MYDRSRRLLISLPDLLFDLPRRVRQGGDALHGDGERALALLLHLDLAHHSCRDHSAVRDCDAEAGAARRVFEAQAGRPVDLSDVAVCVSYRRSGLLHALSSVPVTVIPC